MQKKVKRTRRAKRRGSVEPPQPLRGAQAHLVARHGEPAIQLLVWIRSLDMPYAEFEEHLALLPPDWSGILDLPEARRTHEFIRRARAFVCAGGATIDEQDRKFAREDYGGGAFLCSVLRAFDERRVEIRVEPHRPVPIEGLTAAEWSAAAEHEVLDLVRRHGGTFRVPPPAPGGWVYEGSPESGWNRTPIWKNGKAPEWCGLAEATLKQIDLSRRAEVKGWPELARYHERAAVEGLTKLRAFGDARTGRLISFTAHKKLRLSPEQEDAALAECARRRQRGEKFTERIDPEVGKKFGVSARTMRELRLNRGLTSRKARRS